MPGNPVHAQRAGNRARHRQPVFISIAVSKLPEERRPFARKLGIAVACITRIALLVSLAYLAHMAANLFTVAGMGISIRDRC